MNGILAILLASLFWGTTGTMAASVPDVTSYALGALSTGGGGLLLALTAYKSLLKDWEKLRSNVGLCLLGGVFVALYPIAFYTSMRFSGVAIGTVICIATAPFAAALLERLISKSTGWELRWLASVGFGVVGIILMTLPQASSLSGNDTSATVTDEKFVLGIVFAVLGGFTYAGYTWVAKRLIEHGVTSTSAMGCQFGISALLLLPSLWWTGHAWLADSHHLFVAGYMVVIPICLGYLLFGYGLKSVAASQATLLSLLEPVIATLLAVTIVGETLSGLGWLGMGAIMVCLIMQSWPSKSATLRQTST
ncbi:DMT family transporter [Vibrio tritonius]|uniref:DMT family transporter n=1 Tax=Vibrio tritonius TaxID=1435069 RepID=UPI00315D7BD0